MTVDEFIEEWWGKPGGSERSNFAPFIFDLCDLLGEKRPGQSEQGKLGDYEFEGAVPKGSFRSLDARGAIGAKNGRGDRSVHPRSSHDS
ncbi:hypothetical protein [Sphingomonas sp.]|uniref:hypothetical protein n=1 Tax=Sphingomonas sp. TaxID=28214 RepID=UPI00286E610C|nr:hypothetical protein [Sphingomonas sp.]